MVLSPLVACGPDRLVYGRGSSPEHVRLLGIARWGHDCLPCDRFARHVGLPERCRFCDAADGDLWHCLSECPSLADFRAQWAFRCGIPPQALERWSHHSWMCDPRSIHYSPGSVRAHIRFVGEVCQRFETSMQGLAGY